MARDADGDEFVGMTPEPVETPEVEAVEQEQPEAVEEEADEQPEAEAEQQEEGDEKKPRNKPAHKRIDELTRARREAERERDELRSELARLRGDAPQPEVQQAPELQAPDPNDVSKYEFGEADPRFIADLAKYEVRRELAAERAQQEAATRQQEFQSQAQALDNNWQEQTSKAAERYDDFDDAISEYQETQPCPPILAMAIQSSPHAADVAYHLAKNPAENRELAQLAQTNPLEAARRFGRIEARFEKQAEAPKPKAKTVTDAPAPPQHTARGSGGRFTPDYASDNVDLGDVAKAMGLR